MMIFGVFVTRGISGVIIESVCLPAFRDVLQLKGDCPFLCALMGIQGEDIRAKA
jgi:hypothetical protein